MAFNIANLTLMQVGANKRLWEYHSTADTLATIMASGYFGQDSTTNQQSSDMLLVNDIIDVQGSDGQMRLRVDTISGTTVTTEVGSGEAQWLIVPVLSVAASGGLYLAFPFDGNIRRKKVITNGETLDIITVNTLIGGVGVTGLSIALDQSGQGAGEVYQSTATANNAGTEGQAVQITWTASTAQMQATELDLTVMLEFVPA